MASVPNTNVHPLFKPYIGDESATVLLGRLIDREGFSRKTRYHLEILNTLTQNGTKLFERIPPETFRGMPEGGRRNVQASYVARANEGPVRPDPGAVGESQEEIIPPFLIWDKQEQALEAWARAEGCWLDDAVSAVEKRFGEEISHGAEAKVFHYDDTHVVKVISSLFDQQKTLDRIALTNFMFPATGLQLLGLGRNADGEFCFIVKQPFIIGKHVDEGLVSIGGLDDFRCVDESVPNPEYATDDILLGDLHDRNILIDICGNTQVIDCNLFLNTPDLGRGGKWVVPEIRYDEKTVRQIEQTLDNLLPLEMDRGWFEREYGSLGEILKGNWFLDGTISDSSGNTYLVEVSRDDPDTILLSRSDKALVMLSADPSIGEADRRDLAAGLTVERNGRRIRFSLEKGRTVFLPSQEKRGQSRRAASDRIHRPSKPHGPSL